MSETRYDWLVDRQPTQNRYTILGDVTGSIKVSMEFKTAVPTEVLRTIPVTFVDVTAGRTFLRGITGINSDNLFTKILCLVPDKPFQFVKRPVVQFPIELRSTTFLHTDFSQVFKSEHCIWELNNLFRDIMILVSHKPSFSTRRFTEFPFGGSSAFGLKCGSEIRVLGTSILHSRRIKECVVGTDRNINDTSIYSEDRLFRSYFRGIGFKLAMQIERIIVLAKGQVRRLDFPRQVLPVIFRDTKCDLNPTFRSRESCILGTQTNPDHSLIVSHCGIFFSERFKMTFHRFQRFTSNISCALHKRGGEIRDRLSNILIGGIVAVNLADSVIVETPIRTSIERHSIISHGFQERLPSIRRNIKFQLDCPNHNHILIVLGIKGNGGDRCGAIPLMTKVMGFLAPRS
jgi:hypothetical protein